MAEEVAEKTRHPKVFIGRIRPNELSLVSARLEELRGLCDGASQEQIRSKFQQLVPEYRPSLPDSIPPRSLTPEEEPATVRVAVAVAR